MYICICLIKLRKRFRRMETDLRFEISKAMPNQSFSVLNSNLKKKNVKSCQTKKFFQTLM